MGCSLSAPATGGFSVFSLQCSMYAAGSEKEKRAGGRLHGGTIAQLFVFCKGSLAGLGVGVGVAGGEGERGRMVLAWPAPSISRGIGLACAVVPPSPPSNAFGNRGTRCTPGGGCAPCALLGERRRRSSPWRVQTPFLACPRLRGQEQSRLRRLVQSIPSRRSAGRRPPSSCAGCPPSPGRQYPLAPALPPTRACTSRCSLRAESPTRRTGTSAPLPAPPPE